MSNIQSAGRFLFPSRPIRAAVLDSHGEVLGVGEVAYSTRDGWYAVRLDGRRNSQEWPARLVSFDEADVERTAVRQSINN